MYRVVVERSAEKDLRRLPFRVRSRVVDALGNLANDPCPKVCDIRLDADLCHGRSSSDHVHLRGAEGSMRRNRIRNLIASQGLPFETLCIASCLTAVVVVTGGLAVGHGIFERDPGGLERLQECPCRVAKYLVGVSAAG